MVEKIMYVQFEKDSGKILRIGPSNSGDNTIEAPLSKVVNLLEGKESFKDYKVEYNSKSKSLELICVYDHIFEQLTVNEFIYEIPTDNLIEPDITVIQDIPNTCWKIQIGKELKRNIRSKGVTFNSNMLFSITAKGDPNVLYKTLSVHFGKVVNDNYFIAPFDMPFETTEEPISVYTPRRFDTYQFKRII